MEDELQDQVTEESDEDELEYSGHEGNTSLVRCRSCTPAQTH